MKATDVLRDALQRISDDDTSGCGCEHDDENCCANVADYCCPYCIAAVALLAAQSAHGSTTATEPELDEAVSQAAALLLIEIAFLVPRGTNINEHPIKKKLEDYKDAIEARSRWRSAHGSQEDEPKVAHARADNERQVIYCTNCNAILWKIVKAKPRPFHSEDDD